MRKLLEVSLLMVAVVLALVFAACAPAAKAEQPKRVQVLEVVWDGQMTLPVGRLIRIGDYCYFAVYEGGIQHVSCN